MNILTWVSDHQNISSQVDYIPIYYIYTIYIYIYLYISIYRKVIIALLNLSP